MILKMYASYSLEIPLDFYVAFPCIVSAMFGTLFILGETPTFTRSKQTKWRPALDEFYFADFATIWDNQQRIMQIDISSFFVA